MPYYIFILELLSIINHALGVKDLVFQFSCICCKTPLKKQKTHQQLTSLCKDNTEVKNLKFPVSTITISYYYW